MEKSEFRKIWIDAQALNRAEPFGAGPQAVALATEQLGYVQIDTINVIERCHHHILFSRIPKYRRTDLQSAQTTQKSVFEYWTHALSYVPTRDYTFFAASMRQSRLSPSSYFQAVKTAEFRKVLQMIRKEGPISIRDIDDDVLVEKNHPWGSRKPSKKALQWGFYSGQFVIAERQGMLKKYELADRHFGWNKKPKPATTRQIYIYLLDRALRAQGVVSLDSICHLNAKAKPAIRALIEQRVRAGLLVPLKVGGVSDVDFWATPETLERTDLRTNTETHLLSPFDPLMILRKRVKAIFDYDHKFEAYLPKEKRQYGYFALPVLMGDEIVAAIDLKTDRVAGELLVQQLTWLPKKKSAERRRRLDEALHTFSEFQLGENE